MRYIADKFGQGNNVKSADNLVDLLLKISTEEDIIHIIDKDMTNCVTIESLKFIGKITTGEIIVACAKHRGIYDELALEVLRSIAPDILQMVSTLKYCFYRQTWKIERCPI